MRANAEVVAEGRSVFIIPSVGSQHVYDYILTHEQKSHVKIVVIGCCITLMVFLVTQKQAKWPKRCDGLLSLEHCKECHHAE